MSLVRYRRKRNFKITPEPAGRRKRSGPRLHYVIQKHAARRLHYDFRLELDGALKSWAVPKGPSLDPADKRLAVHVEDHPLDYGRFEGVIPEQQYGAGPVILWDRGTWTPVGDPRRAYREGRLKFHLQGEKLQGGWALVRMNGREAAGKENWLLIKERDETARRGEGSRLVDDRPESVLTGRTVESLRSGETPVSVAKRRSITRRPAPGGARREAFPDRLEPQLATLFTVPPTGNGWGYEVKFDGYRLLTRIKDGKPVLFTRNGHDWTAKFPGIARALAALKLKSTWLDGEVCVMDKQGRTSFSALQRTLSRESGDEPIYLLFDAPILSGADLRQSPLRERKSALAQLLARTGRASVLRLSEHVEGDGNKARAQACKLGLEGLIGKRLDGAYLSGRSRDWIKLKCRQRQEFVIGGYTPPRGSRSGFGSLLLGVYENDGQLRYAGRVGTGFDNARLESMRRRLQALAADESPFKHVPRDQAVRGTRWVHPQLVGEVTFAEWTHDGHVRQASFEGLREDKPAREIGRERPLEAVKVRPAGRARSKSSPAKGNQIAGTTITHPERVVYPEANLTKLDVALYYERVAGHILPYIRNRPLSIVRCPAGARKTCFFQKHASERAIPGVATVMIRDGGGSKPYIVANTVEALVGLAQMGTIELHAWNATTEQIEHPDMLVIDLDPDIGLPWRSVMEAARAAHLIFDKLELESFVKTTGGKGLHVVVPLARRHTWEEVRDFSRAIAARLEHALPERFTAVASKARRKGKIYVDYLRNGRGATAVAPFSLRTRPGATIAMPLAWEDLTPSLHPDAFTLATIEQDLARRREPWARYAAVRQTITPKMIRAVAGL